MLGSIPSCALLGIEAFAVTAEVDISSGLPGYHVVGLPAASVKEGAVRIRSALERVGHAMPARKITVNLAPADKRKTGAAFDLPIAVGILVADGLCALGPLAGLLMLGELGLDGSLRSVRGALSAGLLARQLGLRGVLLPTANAAEAAVVSGIEVYAASHIGDVVCALQGGEPLARVEPSSAGALPADDGAEDMSDVRGMFAARAALEIAVAGGHNLLLLGPPGIGKTMLARRIPTVLPPMTHVECLETTQIYSAVGLAGGELVQRRPYRAPHHSISTPALIGGGSPPRPGEISLAHNGVLFLDELPEFRRAALESLRQPLEDRMVTVGRVHGTATLPSSFLLVASANPCPCGWSGSSYRVCTCGPRAVERYQGKLSGPLLDRIDLQVFVHRVGLAELRSSEPAECSAAIRDRVIRARALQRRRLAPHGHRTNAEMTPRVLRATCPLTAAAEDAIARLYERERGMTARSVARLIKVARTIADLEGRGDLDAECIYEAASYRVLGSETDGPASGDPTAGDRYLALDTGSEAGLDSASAGASRPLSFASTSSRTGS